MPPLPLTFSEQIGLPGHCLQAQVFDALGNSVACIEPSFEPQVATDTAKLFAAAPDLLAFAKAQEAWGAEFILDGNCWPMNESGLPVFSEAVLAKFLELQKIRNAAISKTE